MLSSGAERGRCTGGWRKCRTTPWPPADTRRSTWPNSSRPSPPSSNTHTHLQRRHLPRSADVTLTAGHSHTQLIHLVKKGLFQILKVQDRVFKSIYIHWRKGKQEIDNIWEAENELLCPFCMKNDLGLFGYPNVLVLLILIDLSTEVADHNILLIDSSVDYLLDINCQKHVQIFIWVSRWCPFKVLMFTLMIWIQ